MNPKIPSLILGSKSPRRAEIMRYFALPFEQISSDFDEESVPFTGDPILYVSAIAQGKAAALAMRFPESAILTADTTVFHAGKIYNKPRDNQEAYAMLRAFSGQWHSVYTAVSVRHGQLAYSACEESRVLFNELSDAQIHYYIDKLHVLDKAGGYSIHGAGGLMVRRLEGCYYNVLGLPINTAQELLQKIGIDLWHYLQ